MRPRKFTFLFSSFDLWLECTSGVRDLRDFPSLGPRLWLWLDQIVFLIVRNNLQAWPDPITGVLPEGACGCGGHWPMTDAESRRCLCMCFVGFYCTTLLAVTVTHFFLMWRSLSILMGLIFFFANFFLCLWYDVLKCALLGTRLSASHSLDSPPLWESVDELLNVLLEKPTIFQENNYRIDKYYALRHRGISV